MEVPVQEAALVVRRIAEDDVDGPLPELGPSGGRGGVTRSGEAQA